MTLDLSALAAAMVEQMTPAMRKVIAEQTATTTTDFFRRATETALGAELGALCKRTVRSVVARLDGDSSLVADVTTAARAAFLDGVRQGAMEAGVKVGAQIGKAAVKADQVRLIGGEG